MTSADAIPLPEAAEPDADFRQRVRADLAETVVRHADACEDAGRIPHEIWRAMGERGLLSLPHEGPGFLRSAIVLDELGRSGYAGIRAAVGVHAYMARSYLERSATAEQRDRYLSAVYTGDRVAALALTERSAGTALDVATHAEPTDDGGYRVNGIKEHITNGSTAGFFVTLVQTGRSPGLRGVGGTSFLLIDADLPGVTVAPAQSVGWRSADVCTIVLDDVAVPPGRLLGRPHRAFLQLMPALDFERLCAGLLALGGVQFCLDLMLRFVGEHRIGDAPLGDRQVVRHRLADLIAETELLRAYANRAAQLRSVGRLDTRTASVLKLRATELATAAAQVCVQYLGARGQRSAADAARIYRDAPAATIAAGASELMRDLIYDESRPR